MVTMIHDARVPEKTLLDLPPLVPSQRAGGTTPARVQSPGVPSGATEKDTGELACAEPGVRCGLPHPANREST